MATLLSFFYFVGDDVEFFASGAIYFILMIGSDHNFICRNTNDVEAINFLEFDRFRICSSSHASQFRIKSEIVLKGYSCHGLSFTLNLNMFFRFKGAVKPVTVTTTSHQTTCKFIDNNDFAVTNNIVHVFFENDVGLECLLGVMQKIDVGRIIKIIDAQPFF